MRKRTIVLVVVVTAFLIGGLIILGQILKNEKERKEHNKETEELFKSIIRCGYNGKTYKFGDIFPASEYCVDCFCGEEKKPYYFYGGGWGGNGFLNNICKICQGIKYTQEYEGMADSHTSVYCIGILKDCKCYNSQNEEKYSQALMSSLSNKGNLNITEEDYEEVICN